jgi:hypothetical protein
VPTDTQIPTHTDVPLGSGLPGRSRRSVRLPVAVAAVALALVVGALLASHVHINVHLAVPTLPALIAGEIVRRFIGAFVSPRKR